MDNRSIAINLFNKTWDLLDKKDLTKEEELLMISQAHASYYHWSLVGISLNLQRGQWMISHVYSVLKMFESAVYHANRCYEITIENNIEDFDLTFAYEGLARAHHLVDNDKASDYLTKAYESLKNIKEDDDRKYSKSVLDELKIILEESKK